MSMCVFICVDKAGVRKRAEKTELLAIFLIMKHNVTYVSGSG